MSASNTVGEFVITRRLYDRVLSHCLRKLRSNFEDGETPERKGYGLIGGRVDSHRGLVTHVFPLRRNSRWDPQHRESMDSLMNQEAIRSETPLDRRGWVADPMELFEAHKTCEANGAALFGSYHMHRVRWVDDPLRDTCTAVDTRLAEGSGLWIIIVSLVEPDAPIVRAFYEGVNAQEAKIRITATKRSVDVTNVGEGD